MIAKCGDQFYAILSRNKGHETTVLANTLEQHPAHGYCFHGLRNMLSVIMGWKSTLLSVAGVVIRDDILVD